MERKINLPKLILLISVAVSTLMGQTAFLPDTVAFVGQSDFKIPIYMENLVALEGLDISIDYDETVINCVDYSQENTVLENYNVYFGEGNCPSGSDICLVISMTTVPLFSGSGNVIYLNCIIEGNDQDYSELNFSEIEIQNIDVNAFPGSVTIFTGGCMEIDACNYDETATYDDGSCAYIIDCEGVCGGSVELDCFGLCAGNAIEDCNGECNGLALIDECGVCGGSGPIGECGCTDILEGFCDCSGNILDECGWCGGEGCYQGDCETYPADQFDCDGPLANDLTTPIEFILLPNYPNPFNPTTTFNYSVATFSVVNLLIYSMSGEIIHTLVSTSQQPGQYTVQWNASNYSSGLYFVKLISDNKMAEQKVLLIK